MLSVEGPSGELVIDPLALDAPVQIISYTVLAVVKVHNPTIDAICAPMRGRLELDGRNMGVFSTNALYTMNDADRYYEMDTCILPGKSYDYRLNWTWTFPTTLNPRAELFLWSEDNRLLLKSIGFVMGPGVGSQSELSQRAMIFRVSGDAEIRGFIRMDSGLFPCSSLGQVRLSLAEELPFVEPLGGNECGRGGNNYTFQFNRPLTSYPVWRTSDPGHALYLNSGDRGDTSHLSQIIIEIQ